MGKISAVNFWNALGLPEKFWSRSVQKVEARETLLLDFERVLGRYHSHLSEWVKAHKTITDALPRDFPRDRIKAREFFRVWKIHGNAEEIEERTLRVLCMRRDVTDEGQFIRLWSEAETLQGDWMSLTKFGMGDPFDLSFEPDVYDELGIIADNFIESIEVVIHQSKMRTTFLARRVDALEQVERDAERMRKKVTELEEHLSEARQMVAKRNREAQGHRRKR